MSSRLNSILSAVVLAAGESKRMPEPKLLLRFGDSTILERSIDNLLSSKVSELTVVLGHKAGQMKKCIGRRPVTLIVNPAYYKGMSTSLVAGLGLVSDESSGIMIALADQPLVDSETINLLIEAFTTSDKGIVIPVYQGRRGNPVIFANRYKDELLKVEGDKGGREVIKQHPDDVLEVNVNCEGVCIDIDTEDAYLKAGKILTGKHSAK